MFSGAVDLDAIARVKRAVRVPVLGNGSILSPQDAIAMIRKTGVDALMIGRGAVGNPWIFSRLLHWLKTGELPPPPGLMEKKEMTLRHLGLLRQVLGERLAPSHSRKHLPAYTKGLRGGSAMRERVNRMTDMDAVLREVEVFFDNLALRARVTVAGRAPMRLEGRRAFITGAGGASGAPSRSSSQKRARASLSPRERAPKSTRSRRRLRKRGGAPGGSLRRGRFPGGGRSRPARKPGMGRSGHHGRQRGRARTRKS